MKNKYFNFEVYTLHPETKETGWDIFMVSVKAETVMEARIKLKEYPNFDCVILFNYEHIEEETANFLIVENWPTFKILERL